MLSKKNYAGQLTLNWLPPLSCDAANQIAHKAGAYLIITESQLEAAELRLDYRERPSTFTATCATSPGWTKVFENAGGVIFHIEGVSNGN